MPSLPHGCNIGEVKYISKTALTQVETTPTPPWGKAFRWKISHLPSGDSVESSFQAIDPSSSEVEAALYHSQGVVLEKVIGEPAPPKTNPWIYVGAFGGGIVLAIGIWLFGRQSLADVLRNERATAVNAGGCKLSVKSSVVNTSPLPQVFLVGGSPWQISSLGLGNHDSKFSCRFKEDCGQFFHRSHPADKFAYVSNLTVASRCTPSTP